MRALEILLQKKKLLQSTPLTAPSRKEPIKKRADSSSALFLLVKIYLFKAAACKFYYVVVAVGFKDFNGFGKEEIEVFGAV